MLKEFIKRLFGKKTFGSDKKNNKNLKGKYNTHRSNDVFKDKIVKPKVVKLSSRNEFEFEVLYGAYTPTTILTVDRELNRIKKEVIVGAAVVINAENLLIQKKMISRNEVKRSGDSLREADVPGYDFLAKKYNRRGKDGKYIYYWHRTHLIPFRHTLSEGDSIENLVFAGTAHLNSGNRPHIKYYVKPGKVTLDSRDSRKDNLLQEASCRIPLIDINKAKQTLMEGKSIIKEHYSQILKSRNLQVIGAPKGSYYSLDDVEQTVDIIIENNPKDIFTYATFLYYEKDYEVSPKWVNAVLINKSKNNIVFNVRLINDL